MTTAVLLQLMVPYQKQQQLASLAGSQRLEGLRPLLAADAHSSDLVRAGHANALRGGGQVQRIVLSKAVGLAGSINRILLTVAVHR